MSNLDVKPIDYIDILFDELPHSQAKVQQKEAFASVFSEISENRTIHNFIPLIL